MKKLYTKPEVDITVYKNADVIATVATTSGIQSTFKNVSMGEITAF